MSHALERTSPKGGPFIGRCTKCGRDGIALKDMHGHCPNPANITDDEALLHAVRG
jgi:hypothetical protein